MIEAANLAGARRLLIAIPDGFEAGQIAEQARSLNSGLQIIARAHSDAEAVHLLKHGADAAIVGERELARAMLARALAAAVEEIEPSSHATGGDAADADDPARASGD